MLVYRATLMHSLMLSLMLDYICPIGFFRWLNVVCVCIHLEHTFSASLLVLNVMTTLVVSWSLRSSTSPNFQDRKENQSRLCSCVKASTPPAVCFLGRTRKWVFPRIKTPLALLMGTSFGQNWSNLDQFCLTEAIKGGWKDLLNLGFKWIFVNIAGCHHIKYYETFF